MNSQIAILGDPRTPMSVAPFPRSRSAIVRRQITNLTWAVAFLPFAVAVIFSLASIVRGRGYGNLPDFLGAARNMLNGRDLYGPGAGEYVYPPLIAFLYQPLAMLPVWAAAIASLTINAGFAVWTLVLGSRFLVERLAGSRDRNLIARVAAFGALATADKIKGEFAHLETNVFVLWAFVIAIRWLDRKPWISGLALGWAFNIKYMPIAVVPYLVLRRRWSAIVWLAFGVVGFALLPACSLGWTGNLEAWSQAGGGVGRLFGIRSSVVHPAHVRLISDGVSISITSGLARNIAGPERIALLMAALLATSACFWVAGIYVLHELPVVKWPSAVVQTRATLGRLVPVEWAGLMLLILAFSPFTNSRHLYMLLLANLVAGVLILKDAGRQSTRRWLFCVVLATTFGVSMPPGGVGLFDRVGDLWRGIGGPSWCIVVMFVVLMNHAARSHSSIAAELE